MDPTTELLQAAADMCFPESSVYVLTSVGTLLVGTITSLFGLLMLSYRSRIQTAEQRELSATKDRNEAVRERDEALWRLDDTRSQYREFAVETRASTSPNGRRQRRLPSPDRG